MRRIQGLVQFKTGDAVRGVVSRRSLVFRFLKVEQATLLDAGTQSETKADGVFWVPKSNVLFVQQLVAVTVA